MKKSSLSTSTSEPELNPAAQRLLAYLDERCAVLKGALNSATAYYAVEGIHNLRVEIKRMRALYKLLDYTLPSFTHKPSAQSLRDLFRAAGKLRDTDIFQAATLPHLKRLDLREYFNQLKHDELQYRDDFQEVASDFSDRVLGKSRQQISSALTIITENRMRKRMRKRIRRLDEKLRKLMQANDAASDHLHAVRKISKELKYSLDLWQKCFGAGRTVARAANELKKTYGFLGEWHDIMLALASVGDFLKPKNRVGLADPFAYEKFQFDLRGGAAQLLKSYERGKGPLENSLERLNSSLRAQRQRQGASTR